MEDHVKVRLEYVALVRARKLKEAQIVLESIWARKPVHSVNKNVIIDVVEKPKKIIKVSPVVPQRSLDDLSKIKGIGNKTVQDIKMMFNDIESLIIALKNDRVALRDDVVDKLKEELI